MSLRLFAGRCTFAEARSLTSFATITTFGIRPHARLLTNSSFVRPGDAELFNHTSGRWLYNEEKRLQERYLKFDVDVLAKTAAVTTGRRLDDVQSLRKFRDSKFHRIFEVTMRDGSQVLARLPYRFLQPGGLLTASEVATMDLASRHGIRAPHVYGYSADKCNPVGSEYIIMEKFRGKRLNDVWFDLSEQSRVRVVDTIVNWEAKFFNISFPAFGSIFFEKDLPSHVGRVPINGQAEGLCIGPDVSFEHWEGTRSQLNIPRRPTTTPLEMFEAAANREITWLQTYGKPRLPQNPQHRELFDHQKVDPKEHLSSLEAFEQVAPYVVPKEDYLCKPALRYAEVYLHNILVGEDDDGEVDFVGLLDWQYTSVRPLFLQAQLPAGFHYYQDGDPEALQKSEIPADIHLNSKCTRNCILDIYHRKPTQWYYMEATARKFNDHFQAMMHKNADFLRQMYWRAALPWEGNSVLLQRTLLHLAENWPEIAGEGIKASEAPSECPISFTQQEAKDIKEKKGDMFWKQSFHKPLESRIGVECDGAVSHEGYKQAKIRAAEEKAEALREAAGDEAELKTIELAWPFDDHDED